MRCKGLGVLIILLQLSVADLVHAWSAACSEVGNRESAAGLQSARCPPTGNATPHA